VHSGYLEAGAAVTRMRGPEAWVEAGLRPWEHVGFFARGQADSQDAGVMAGVRMTFDF
jgi:hypothetical protein